MRVPGTVSYPSANKRSQGYTDELVVLKINPKPPPSHGYLHLVRCLTETGAQRNV